MNANKSNRKSHGFTVDHFFRYLYSQGKLLPFGVDKYRWTAMLKWLESRDRAKDWVYDEKTGNKI